MKKFDFNHQLLGLFLGLTCPWLVMLIFYQTKFSYMEVSHFFQRILYLKLLTPLLSVCAIINLALFYIFYWLKKDKSSRGVVLATLIYAAIVMIIKLS